MYRTKEEDGGSGIEKEMADRKVWIKLPLPRERYDRYQTAGNSTI